MDLQELKRRALTEPDPRVQAQYADQLVKAAEAETRKSARRPISKRSGFYDDGYADGLSGAKASPPGDYKGTTVNEQDYNDGYRAGSAMKSDAAALKQAGFDVQADSDNGGLRATKTYPDDRAYVVSASYRAANGVPVYDANPDGDYSAKARIPGVKRAKNAAEVAALIDEDHDATGKYIAEWTGQKAARPAMRKAKTGTRWGTPEGESSTPEYRIEFDGDPGVSDTPQGWSVKRNGEPNAANLARYMRALISSTLPGNTNSHLGTKARYKGARLINQADDSVVAEWKVGPNDYAGAKAAKPTTRKAARRPIRR